MLLPFSHTEGRDRLKKYPGSLAWIGRVRLIENVENWEHKAQSVWNCVCRLSSTINARGDVNMFRFYCGFAGMPKKNRTVFWLSPFSIQKDSYRTDVGKC